MKISAADINDPLYYLKNFLTALDWVSGHSRDLLSSTEQRQLDRFLSLPQDAQALLLRMVMRKGELFRTGTLQYSEIADPHSATELLIQQQFCTADPSLDAPQLALFIKKEELLALLHQHAPGVTDTPLPADLKRRPKAQLISLCETLFAADDIRPASHWLNTAGPQDSLLRLDVMALFDTIRLLFFGNGWQSWSEFVVTELGHLSYEAVPLERHSRPFHQRTELDFYRQLSNQQEQLAIIAAQRQQKQLTKEAGAALIAQCAQALRTLRDSAAGQDYDAFPLWLQQRWHRLMARCGRESERCQDLSLALSCYQLSDHREASARCMRVLELQAGSQEDYLALLGATEQQLALIHQPETRILIQCIRQRAAKKAGLTLPPASFSSDFPRALKAFPSLPLVLTDNGDPVEYQVMDHMNQQSGGQCFYVENTLLPGLFALLFWPALYAPVSGAFFHPFQAGPADLFRDYFAALRPRETGQAFAALQDESYKRRILNHWQEKQGISCPLIHWRWLSRPLLEKALAVIPAAQLEAVFRHLLKDLKNHCRGLPDLIWLGEQPGEWKLIEVKGPGDRLQDHQKLWLEFFLQQGITAEVCYVDFNPASAPAQ